MKALHTAVFCGMIAMLLAAAPLTAATNVAVFNFQMTSETPDWKWLEKGLADRITTDFAQDKGLAVVARDEMQLLAATLHWVPEMATTDAKGMGQIKTQLKVETLVTGVYRVEGEQITITGQIIDVATRRETARREASGKADQVLDLQRQLSAELMGVVLNKPAAQILPTLPVWTRSLPAAKALYEGMDLYDQGRYAEGWLKFRQASREDPQYMEAQYFVGKMYYFMDRYEHARRALEKFVYLDMAHPRVGDAMVEYVHTYENSSASADDLLRLYEGLGTRFPNAPVWQGRAWGRSAGLRSDQWFRFKRIHLLTQLGRHEEVVRMTSGPVLDDFGWSAEKESDCALPYGLMSLMEHHARTGEIPAFKVGITTDAGMAASVEESGGKWLKFDASGRPQTVSIQPQRLTGEARAAGDRTMVFDKPWARVSVGLRTPSGYVFQALQFQAMAEGEDGYLEVRLRRPDNFGDLNQNTPGKRVDLREARSQGIRFDAPPPMGILVADCWFGANGPQGGPITMKGLTVKPTLARVQGAAVLDVACQNTADFRVYVDDVLWRWYPGRVGPLAPGAHKVRLTPGAPGTPYGEWSTTVTVKAGDTLPLMGCLPWADQDLWGKWKSVLVGTAYPAPSTSLWSTDQWEVPALQADDQAIRLVWSLRGDLWSSVSTDGEQFSPPRKLDLPVSSGWNEYSPYLVKDESGRFVLVFLSDRDPRHRNLPYICWSRDFVHWSNPALVLDETVRFLYGLMQDSQGRLILDYGAKDRRLLISADGIQWKSEKMPGSVMALPDSVLAQDRTGLFCLYKLAATREESPQTRYPVSRRTSGDLHQWSAEEVLGTFESQAGFHGYWLTLLEGEKGPCLLGFEEKGTALDFRREVSLCEPDPTGRWQPSGRIWGLLPGRASVTRHPRWGIVIAALSPEDHLWWLREASGPYVLRGPDLGALREYRNPVPPPVYRNEVMPPKKPQLAGKIAPRVSSAGQEIGMPFHSIRESWEPPRASKVAVGELTYVYAFLENQNSVEGSRHFRPPSPDCGTVHPQARVVTLEVGGQKLAVALDAEKADAPYYDVVRLDPTGKGDFRSALRIPRIYLCPHPDPQSGREKLKYEFAAYEFAADVPSLALGQRQVGAGIVIHYEEGATLGSGTALRYGFSTCAVGECRFGDKVYKVRFRDRTGNLSVRDTQGPDRVEDYAGFLVTGQYGDWFCVDSYEDGDKIRRVLNVQGEGDPIQYDGRLWRINERRIPQAMYGQPVLVDGRWWDVRVTEDGRRVTAEPSAGPMAGVQLEHPFWRLILIGEKSILQVQGEKEPVPVPAGRYGVYSYKEYLSPAPNYESDVLTVTTWSEGAGNPGEMTLHLKAATTTPAAEATRSFRLMTLDLKAGTTTPVRLGSPLRATATVTQKSGALCFGIVLADVAGREAYVNSVFHNQAPIRIILTGPSGQRAATFEATSLYEARDRGWKIPPGFGGTYTVTAEFPDNFPIEANPVRVTVP